MVTCDNCRRQADESETLTWATSMEHGQRRNYCEECSRANLRAMEGKLDSEHW